MWEQDQTFSIHLDRVEAHLKTTINDLKQIKRLTPIDSGHCGKRFEAVKQYNKLLKTFQQSGQSHVPSGKKRQLMPLEMASVYDMEALVFRLDQFSLQLNECIYRCHVLANVKEHTVKQIMNLSNELKQQPDFAQSIMQLEHNEQALVGHSFHDILAFREAVKRYQLFIKGELPNDIMFKFSFIQVLKNLLLNPALLFSLAGLKLLFSSRENDRYKLLINLNLIHAQCESALAYSSLMFIRRWHCHQQNQTLTSVEQASLIKLLADPKLLQFCQKKGVLTPEDTQLLKDSVMDGFWTVNKRHQLINPKPDISLAREVSTGRIMDKGVISSIFIKNDIGFEQSIIRVRALFDSASSRALYRLNKSIVKGVISYGMNHHFWNKRSKLQQFQVYKQAIERCRRELHDYVKAFRCRNTKQDLLVLSQLDTELRSFYRQYEHTLMKDSLGKEILDMVNYLLRNISKELQSAQPINDQPFSMIPSRA